MINNIRIKAAAGGIVLIALLLSGCAADTENVINADAGAGAEESLQEQLSLQGENVPTQQEESLDQPLEGLLTVTFLDVGQGNSVLVENEGAYMLIDGGDRDYSSYVVSYLKNQGVEELDYVVSSHYDADHLNGVIGALHAFSCETLLAADYTTDTKVYQSLLSVVDEKDIELVYPKMGDTYTFGEAEFTIVCPDTYDYSEDNDNSVGIRLQYGENSFLICGDAGEKVEKMMVQSGLTIESDVYLASHHGSANSSSMAFLEAVRPKAVVISAGRENSYGHPTAAVLENIRTAGAALYRTDLQGTIVVTSDGTQLNWNVEASGDYRSGEELKEDKEKEKPVSGQENAGIETEHTAAGQDTSIDTQANDVTQETSAAYILNMSTKKFHKPSCSSVSTIKGENRAEFEGLREELIDAGYSPCQRCNP